MRLRYVTGSKEYIDETDLVINEPEKLKGKWNEFFGNDNPVYIEIGMGKGQFITGLSKRYPDKNFVGIEMYSAVLYRAICSVEEARKEALSIENDQINLPFSNLIFLRINAEILMNVFEKGEVAGIFLNFSDPWPKKRHAKRRLTSPVFLNIYKNILPQNGKVYFKTDNVDLFDYSLETISEDSSFVLSDVTRDLHSTAFAKENICTEYEDKFSAMGTPINRLVATMIDE